MKIYERKERQSGITVTANTFPLIHIDEEPIVKPHQSFIIFMADIDLKYFSNIQRNAEDNISLQTIIDHGLIHDIYGTLEEILKSDLGKAIKEACKKLACIQGKYKIKFCSNPPRFTQPIRPASHDIYITKGQYRLPNVWRIKEKYEELFAKKTNHDNWRIFSEAKELEGNIMFDPEYHMIYQNRIIKVFLREYYTRYSIIQRGVGRLIKPNYGTDCQLRKEYRKIFSYYEICQLDEPDDDID